MTAAVVWESSQISPAWTLRMLLMSNSVAVCFRYDAGSAQFHRLDEFVLIVGSGENNDAGFVLGDLKALQSRQAVQAGHFQIQQ